MEVLEIGLKSSDVWYINSSASKWKIGRFNGCRHMWEVTKHTISMGDNKVLDTKGI